MNLKISGFIQGNAFFDHQGYANIVPGIRCTKINKTLSLPSEISEPKAQNRDGIVLVSLITSFIEFLLCETH